MNMQEATIVKWHKQPGDSFSKGDVIYEIETEKVTQEIEADREGTLIEILVPEQTEAPVGGAVCIVDVDLGDG